MSEVDYTVNDKGFVVYEKNNQPSKSSYKLVKGSIFDPKMISTSSKLRFDVNAEEALGGITGEFNLTQSDITPIKDAPPRALPQYTDIELQRARNIQIQNRNDEAIRLQLGQMFDVLPTTIDEQERQPDLFPELERIRNYAKIHNLSAEQTKLLEQETIKSGYNAWNTVNNPAQNQTARFKIGVDGVIGPDGERRGDGLLSPINRQSDRGRGETVPPIVPIAGEGEGEFKEGEDAPLPVATGLHVSIHDLIRGDFSQKMGVTLIENMPNFIRSLGRGNAVSISAVVKAFLEKVNDAKRDAGEFRGTIRNKWGTYQATSGQFGNNFAYVLEFINTLAKQYYGFPNGVFVINQIQQGRNAGKFTVPRLNVEHLNNMTALLPPMFVSMYDGLMSPKYTLANGKPYSADLPRTVIFQTISSRKGDILRVLPTNVSGGRITRLTIYYKSLQLTPPPRPSRRPAGDPAGGNANGRRR